MLTLPEFVEKYNIRLTHQQLTAVDSLENPTLLLAVPGSGKTTTLVTRIGYMMFGREIPAENILVMTYTVAASRDMRARFIKIFGEEHAGRIKFATINGVCSSIINKYNANAFRLLENNAGLLRDIITTISGEYPSDHDINNVKTAITYIKNMQLTKGEIAKEFEESEYEIDSIYEQYEIQMRQRHLMDFDDQLVYALKILEKRPDILAQFQNRYKFILVDEAQDTSKIQHKIIKMLVSEGRLFMVGDEDQSIYGFRAAYPKALLDFEKDFENSKVLLLEENFRSTSQIVFHSDRFISKNKARHKKKMFTNNQEGSPISCLNMRREDQYKFLMDSLANPSMQTAILYRNNDSAIPIIYNFLKRGIKCRWKEKESGFFSTPTVLMVCDMLKLVINPRDTEAFLRVYYKLDLSLKKEEANAAAEFCLAHENETVFTAAFKLPDISESKKDRIFDAKMNFEKYQKSSAPIIISGLYMNYDYYDDDERFFLLSRIAEPEDTAQTFLDKLASLKANIESGAADSDSDIILSTIHSCKGLEYDKVILIDILDSMFAMDTGKKGYERNDTSVEEDRRLFFVAATRAKKELLFIDTENAPFITEFIQAKEDIEFIPNMAETDEKRTSRAPKHTKDMQENASKKSNGIFYGNSPADKYKQRTKEAKEKAVPSEVFKPGNKVRHAVFGTGNVVSVENTSITVQFYDGLKVLNIQACIKNNLLKRV